MLNLLQAFPPETLIAFTLGGLALNFTPGIDVFFATACGLQGGPKAGAMAGLGVGLGGIWHVTLATLGLSALIAAHPEALRAIRWMGAGYLLWLAWKSWGAGMPATEIRGALPPARALIRGCLSNMLNPKPVLFILAFLPQFTDPAYGPIWQQILLLGGIFTFTGTLVTMGYGVLAGVMGRAIGRRLGVMNKVAAVLFAGLAARLVTE
ncbi:MAG: LysE family translocator [Rhodobacteraceae bacterium]|nr:LysE family translocator [Paracoccaceae bacterium]MCP5341342.1 LysE family translocator [Paracoccaceae bacterium]